MKNVTLLNDILKLTAESHFITPPIETLVIHTVDDDGEVAGTLVLNRDWDGGGEIITTGLRHSCQLSLWVSAVSTNSGAAKAVAT